MAQTRPDMQHVPEFSVGDLVAEATNPKRVGRVVQIYDFSGERRIVVRFDESSEAVFYASELVMEK